MKADIVERLRRVAVAQATVTIHGCESQLILNPPSGERDTNAELDFAMRLPSLAAEEIERLREQIARMRAELDERIQMCDERAERIAELEEDRGNPLYLHGEISQADQVAAANRLRNGTHRVYIVRANDYARGNIMPMRVATADTLSQMIDRCAADLIGASSTSPSLDASVTVYIAELEVRIER